MTSLNIRLILLLAIINIIVNDFKASLASRGSYAIDQEDEHFHFLISGGFLPPKSVYAKFMVSLRTTRHIEYWGDNHFCAGVIVGNRHILTAAHCVMDIYSVAMRPHRLHVIAGTPQRLDMPPDNLEMEVEQIKTHPNFRRLKSHDIALVILRYAIPAKNEFVQAIKVITDNLTDSARCLTLGWGQIFPEGPYANELMYLDVVITSHDDCHKVFEDYDEVGNICTIDEYGGADICPGDTGGPLICDERLVGILAGSSACIGNRPIKFTNVTYFADWIEESYRSIAVQNAIEGSFIIYFLVFSLALQRLCEHLLNI